MPWHLETLRHRVHLSITGAQLTRASQGESESQTERLSSDTGVQGEEPAEWFDLLCTSWWPGFKADLWMRLMAVIFPGNNLIT